MVDIWLLLLNFRSNCDIFFELIIITKITVSQVKLNYISIVIINQILNQKAAEMEQSQPRQLSKSTMPLSNSEVIKLLRLHYSHKAQEDPQNFVIGNEQGNELRK